MKSVAVIGSGFSSLSAAAILAKAGFEVTVFEKNESLGGRARIFSEDGFTFDMGPSWYWMPDVFEQFYNQFGKTTSDFYDLVRLDPSYKVIFGKNDEWDLSADMNSICNQFEEIEKGSAKKLLKFINDAQIKYEVAMSEFIFKPCQSIFEFVDWKIIKNIFSLNLFSSIASEISDNFKNEKLKKILEFPVLFLGATPQRTPSLYSLMNYADMKLGTWYPMGGMFKIVEAFVKIGKEQNVKYKTLSEVTKIKEHGDQIKLTVNGNNFQYDYIISGADYHHTEMHLLDKEDQMFNENYWNRRNMAPSSLIFYLGLNTKLIGFEHHNLFFDANFDVHANEIYQTHQWPQKPLFYMCVPSKTDATVALKDHENVFILLPISTELYDDNLETRESYFNHIVDRIKAIKGIDITNHIIFKRSYCISDFKKDYYAFKGNAYGLANTLKQTAILKPPLQSSKIKNLFFTGQLTVPGPGVPPAIISGQIVANLIKKREKILN